MSTLSQNLEIDPKRKMQRESFIAQGFRCPSCNGRGEYSTEIGHDKFVTEPCNFCHGVGRVKALITIDWVEDRNN